MAYLIDSLVDSPLRNIKEGWFIARSMNNFNLRCRFSDAFGVLTGKYDAVRYMTEEEFSEITKGGKRNGKH